MEQSVDSVTDRSIFVAAEFKPERRNVNLPLSRKRQKMMILRLHRYSQTGTFQNRYSQTGTFQNRYSQTGTFQNRYSQTGTFQNRYSQTGTVQNRYSQQTGTQ